MPGSVHYADMIKYKVAERRKRLQRGLPVRFAARKSSEKFGLVWVPRVLGFVHYADMIKYKIAERRKRLQRGLPVRFAARKPKQGLGILKQEPRIWGLCQCLWAAHMLALWAHQRRRYVLQEHVARPAMCVQRAVVPIDASYGVACWLPGAQMRGVVFLDTQARIPPEEMRPTLLFFRGKCTPLKYDWKNNADNLGKLMRFHVRAFCYPPLSRYHGAKRPVFLFKPQPVIYVTA